MENFLSLPNLYLKIKDAETGASFIRFDHTEWTKAKITGKKHLIKYGKNRVIDVRNGEYNLVILD